MDILDSLIDAVAASLEPSDERKRNEPALRTRRIRSDATVGSAEKTLSNIAGTKVEFTNPNGRNTRSDKTMKNYRKENK